MEYRSVKGYNGWSQLGFLFVFLGVGFILAGGIQLLISAQILPKGVSSSEGERIMIEMLKPENIGLTRINQVLSTFALLFLPAITWSILCNGKNMLWLGFSKYISVNQLLLGFLIIFTTAIAVQPLSDLSKAIVAQFPSIDTAAKKMEDLYNAQAIALSNLKNVNEYILGLFIMAFFPALFEEVFFRGVLQNIFTRWWKNPMVAIVATAFLFSLIHGSIYLFLTRMALGFVLGLMYYKTKNIWINIVAHFLNNAFALTALFFMKKEIGKQDLDKLEPHLHWSFVIISIGVLISLFYLLTKYSAKNKANIEAKENLLIAENNPYNSITNNN